MTTFVIRKSIIILLLTAGFFLFTFSHPIIQTVHAETADDLRDKINEKNDEIGDLEDELRRLQDQLNDIGQQANTLENSVKELDLTRRKLQTDIRVTEKKIISTNFLIEELSLDIGDKEKTIGKGKLGLAESLRSINEIDELSLIELLVSKDKVSDVINEINNIRAIQESVRDHVDDLEIAKTGLEINKKETESAKQDLVDFKIQLGDQKKIVDQTKAEKDRLLAQTRNQESEYNKIVQEKLRLKALFEQELEGYESQLEYILDPTKLPGKGVLGWPLDSVFITQVFGKSTSSGVLYASGTHSGTDFRASTGTKLYSMANGVVLGEGDTDLTCRGASWGKWITIKYDNGLASTYGHMSLIKVKKGQRVERGELVGYTGNTGHSTAPHLHVTAYAGDAVQVQKKPSLACGGKEYIMPLAARSAYLDALLYTAPLTKDKFKHSSEYRGEYGK